MKKQIVIIVSMVMLLVGCVKNHPSVECDPDTNVLFQFIYKGDGEENIISQRIKKINFDLYDLDGELLQTIETSSDSHALKLAIGEYNLLAWGNANAETKLRIGNQKQTRDNKVYLESGHEGGLGMDSLYHVPKREGGTRISVTSNTDQKIEVLEFKPLHIQVILFIKGYSDPQGPLINICNVPPICDCDGLFQGEGVTYSSLTHIESIIGSDYYVALFNLPRLPNENDIQIKGFSRKDDSELFSFSFAQFLKDEKLDITSRQEVTVPILIEFQSVGIEVGLPGWESESVNPDI